MLIHRQNWFPRLKSQWPIRIRVPHSWESPKSAIWNCPTMLVGWWISWLHVFTGFYPQETMKCNYRINHHSYKVFVANWKITTFPTISIAGIIHLFSDPNENHWNPNKPPPSALAPVVPPKFPGAESARGSVLWGTRCSPLFEPIEMVRKPRDGDGSKSWGEHHSLWELWVILGHTLVLPEISPRWMLCSWSSSTANVCWFYRCASQWCPKLCKLSRYFHDILHFRIPGLHVTNLSFWWLQPLCSPWITRATRAHCPERSWCSGDR